MRRTGLFTLVSSAFVAMLVATSVAQAQGDETGNQAGVFEGAQVESSAPGEDLERKIRALRWGVALSSVAVPLGAAFLVGGSVACDITGIFDESCSPGEVALQGIGISLMIAGTGGLIASAILLRRRKLEQRGLHAERRLRFS
ncbi:MAG: hypothetical protein AAF997_02555, partial [Myxococcota bacterium]